jgi:hypothetical protein
MRIFFVSFDLSRGAVHGYSDRRNYGEYSALSGERSLRAERVPKCAGADFLPGISRVNDNRTKPPELRRLTRASVPILGFCTEGPVTFGQLLIPRRPLTDSGSYRKVRAKQKGSAFKMTSIAVWRLPIPGPKTPPVRLPSRVQRRNIRPSFGFI